MKKTYTTPTLVENGDVVEQTRSGIDVENEHADRTTKNPMPGSLGYFL
ncbi:MAG TPA: hypothetical protein VFK04_14645 [Gemmatimonadaceae bacterium]|jgi:hypothetical protein|nr:hypothetical protein [Gemmatimonadaceae bacterium]